MQDLRRQPAEAATPLQVKLKVRIAEVNRSLLKKIGVNLLATDPTSGFQFGIVQGGGIFLPAAGTRPATGAGAIIRNPLGSTLSRGRQAVRPRHHRARSTSPRTTAW